METIISGIELLYYNQRLSPWVQVSHVLLLLLVDFGRYSSSSALPQKPFIYSWRFEDDKYCYGIFLQ